MGSDALPGMEVTGAPRRRSVEAGVRHAGGGRRAGRGSSGSGSSRSWPGGSGSGRGGGGGGPPSRRRRCDAPRAQGRGRREAGLGREAARGLGAGSARRRAARGAIARERRRGVEASAGTERATPGERGTAARWRDGAVARLAPFQAPGPLGLGRAGQARHGASSGRASPRGRALGRAGGPFRRAGRPRRGPPAPDRRLERLEGGQGPCGHGRIGPVPVREGGATNPRKPRRLHREKGPAPGRRRRRRQATPSGEPAPVPAARGPSGGARTSPRPSSAPGDGSTSPPSSTSAPAAPSRRRRDGSRVRPRSSPGGPSPARRRGGRPGSPRRCPRRARARPDGQPPSCSTPRPQHLPHGQGRRGA